MKPYLKPLPVKLVIVLLLAVTVIIVHSCKKDRSEQAQKNTATTNPTIALAQKWYDSAYTQKAVNSSKQATQSVNKLSQDWSQKFKPYWAKANVFLQSGMTIIELPATENGEMGVAFKPLKDTAHIDFNKLGTLTDLLIVKQQSGFSMYAMTIVADSSYLKGNYSKVANNSYAKMDTNFTGAVLFHRMDGTFVNGWRYQNGQVTRQLSLAPSGSAVIQSTGKLKIDIASSPCSIIEVTTYWEDCTYSESTNYTVPYNCYIYTTVADYQDCSGTDTEISNSGGSPPPPCQVPAPGGSSSGSSGGTPSDASVKGKLKIDVAAPPTGGSGGTNPTPTPPLQPCPTETATTKETTTTDTDKDPCKEKITVSNREANSTIESQNTELSGYISTSPDEYGTSQNLTSVDETTYKNTAITTDGLVDQFTPTFNWDSVNGYTIGFSHDHPSNNPPDPLDVFPMIANATNTNLVASGTASLQFYQNNVSTTIVTYSGNYVITVNNWAALQSAYGQYTSQGSRAFLSQYTNLAHAYQDQHPGVSLIEAGEYALLKLFGNAINLYITNPDSTTYTPLTINSSNQVSNPC